MSIVSHVLVQGKDRQLVLSMDQLADFLTNGERLGFRVSSFGEHIETYGELEPIENVYTYIPVERGKFHDVTLLGNIPKESHSLIGVVHRRLVADGLEPRWERTRKVYRGPFGQCDLLEVKV